ncbi:MAG: YdcF family protein, partial [Chloroflexi bacterium]
MFVFLSKFLPTFVYPIGLTFLLILLALFLRRRRRLQTTLLVLTALLLLIGGNRWVAFSLARSLEWRYLPLDPVPQADAIVVLGGGTESIQFPRPAVEVNSAGDRVLYAARLYKEGKAPHILLSGGNISWYNSRMTTPAYEMASLLDLIEIPEEAVWLQPKSQNTREDALYSSQMLKEKGIKRVLLVTSAQHMPRSVGLFEHEGVEVIPAPVDYTVTQAGWDDLFSPDLQTMLVNLMPNVGSLSLASSILKEYI